MPAAQDHLDTPKQHVSRSETDVNIQNELRQMKEMMQSMVDHMKDVDQRRRDQKDHLEYLSHRKQFEEDDFEDRDVHDVPEDDMMVEPHRALITKRKKKMVSAKLEH